MIWELCPSNNTERGFTRRDCSVDDDDNIRTLVTAFASTAQGKTAQHSTPIGGRSSCYLRMRRSTRAGSVASLSVLCAIAALLSSVTPTAADANATTAGNAGSLWLYYGPKTDTDPTYGKATKVLADIQALGGAQLPVRQIFNFSDETVSQMVRPARSLAARRDLRDARCLSYYTPELSHGHGASWSPAPAGRAVPQRHGRCAPSDDPYNVRPNTRYHRVDGVCKASSDQSHIPRVASCRIVGT